MIIMAQSDDDGLEGSKEDHAIEKETHVFDVIEIELKFPPGSVNAGRIGEFDLGPTRDPGRHHQALAVKRDGAGQGVHKLGAFRSRTDQAHFSLDHID